MTINYFRSYGMEYLLIQNHHIIIWIHAFYLDITAPKIISIYHTLRLCTLLKYRQTYSQHIKRWKNKCCLTPLTLPYSYQLFLYFIGLLSIKTCDFKTSLLLLPVICSTVGGTGDFYH